MYVERTECEIVLDYDCQNQLDNLNLFPIVSASQNNPNF